MGWSDERDYYIQFVGRCMFISLLISLWFFPVAITGIVVQIPLYRFEPRNFAALPPFAPHPPSFAGITTKSSTQGTTKTPTPPAT